MIDSTGYCSGEIGLVGFVCEINKKDSKACTIPN